MDKSRLEAFSDGVLAIVITIIVLLIEIPDGTDAVALKKVMSLTGCYALSFVLVGMRWTNHHHLFKLVGEVDGKTLWANLLYLFTLSLFPFATGWIGRTGFAPLPTTVFAAVNLVETASFRLLERAIIASHGNEALKRAVGNGRKELLSIVMEAGAVAVSFIPKLHLFSYVLLLAMSAMWIIPDLRMRRAYFQEHQNKEA